MDKILKHTDRKLHLFLISSPLLLISATVIRLQYLKQIDNNDICLFCEGNDYEGIIIDKSIWGGAVIVGKSTRPSTNKRYKDHLNYNLDIIKSKVFDGAYSSVVLYISDMYWLFNNLTFTYLASKFNGRFDCALLDEGIVMYTRQQMTRKVIFRSALKYCWLKLNGFPATLLRRINYEHNHALVKTIYSYHPELLIGEKRRSKSLLLCPEVAMKEGTFAVSEFDAGSTGSVLILSQPMYRVIKEAEYMQMIVDMLNYFRQRGIEKFSVKPHAADSAEWINYLVNDLGVSLFQVQGRSAPIEIYASSLNFDYVVSMTSSALLNLKKFGYRGKCVSFGFKFLHMDDETREAYQIAFANLDVAMI